MGHLPSEPGYDTFALDFLETSASGTNDYLSSPMSVFLLLTTLLGSGGTKGNTKLQIANAVGVYEEKGKQKAASKIFNSIYKNLTEEKASGENIITIGNGMFVKEGAKVKEKFVTTMKRNFDSEVANVDFTAQESTRKTINAWVSNKTNKLIPELFTKPLSTATILALINTLYFKGKWKKPFSNRSTAVKTFKPSNQPIIKISMMHISETIEYGKFEHFNIHMISKPFTNARFTFVVILPTEPGRLEYPDKVLRGEIELPELMKQLQQTQVTLGLPRFKLDTSLDLVGTIKSMGVTDLFDPKRADLSGITKAKISADVLKQSASIKVNEEGVEAAAATVLSISLTSVRNQKPIPFNVNESFVCFIYDKVLNTPLFAGRVITPVALKD
ncbi:unnamed protein product [Trichobilharzia szidati]|nr:unnamed protein product [Trichobilharzia szidati]